MNRFAKLSLLLVLVTAMSACALGLRSPKIAEVRNDPARYYDRTVNIDGVVTTSWGLPLMPFRFYKIEDGTGELTVVSNSARMPVKGSHVHVKGKVNELAVLGGQSLGLHLREQNLSIKGR